MKVSATLKNGRVYIRIADKNKRIFKKTNIRVPKQNFKEGRVTSHPNAAMYNKVIAKEILKYEAGIVSPESELGDANFKRYCLDQFSKWEKTKAPNTLKRDNSELNKLSFFDPHLKFSSLDQVWLQKYHDHLYSIGNKPNTVWNSFKFIRKIVKRALKERPKLLQYNPFDVFDMPKYKDPNMIFLTKAQVKKIETYSLRCREELKLIAVWFVISCRTGLRFGDMRSFNPKQIKSRRLIIYTEKKDIPVSFPMDKRLTKLLERINYKPLAVTNQYANRVLKIIGEACGIEELSFHQARHTFGTLAASAGLRREAIARLMGHTDLRSTAIYSKLTDPTLDLELQKMKF